MGILLSLPGFHLKPTSNTTATMWLDNDYDLYIDINKNPGSWPALRKRGGLRTETKLRGGHVPADDIEAADKLIKKYQAALVDRVLELESRDQAEDKNELEILRPPKRNNKIPFKYEEAPGEERDGKEGKGTDYIIKGLYQQEIEKKAEAAQREEPNLEGMEEAEGEAESQAIEQMKKEEGEKTEIDYLSHKWELEGINQGEGEDLQESSPADPEGYMFSGEEGPQEESLPAWDEKDQALEREINQIRAQPIQHSPSESSIDPLIDQAVQLQSEAPEACKEAPLLNEIRITRNPGGYSWKIISRAESLEEAVEEALTANRRLKNRLE